MSDYRNASFEDLHRAEKNAEAKPLRHAKVGVAIAGMIAMRGAWTVIVPDSYVGEDTEAEQVTVTCTCGTETHIEGTFEPTPCEGKCGRWFLDDGQSVRVTKTPPAAT
jgi:hypothetical protein